MLVEVSENRFINTERIVRVEPMDTSVFSIAVYLDDDYQTVLIYTDQEARVLLGGLQNEIGYGYKQYQKEQDYQQVKTKERFVQVKDREVRRYEASWNNAPFKDFADSVSTLKQWFGPGDKDAASAPPAGADRNGDEVGPGEEAG